VMVGEEAVAENPNLLEALRDEEACWLIDPIDGTINFAAGVPLFATLVALIIRGEVVGGWVYDPCMTSWPRPEGLWCLTWTANASPWALNQPWSVCRAACILAAMTTSMSSTIHRHCWGQGSGRICVAINLV